MKEGEEIVLEADLPMLLLFLKIINIPMIISQKQL